MERFRFTLEIDPVDAPRRPLCFEKEADGREEIQSGCLPEKCPDDCGIGVRVSMESAMLGV